ncbi:Maf family protein [Candidatus Laterigemmans baculatus]|uniref:Maf family protein n=1 Tax=Candidatus Laterigemmans baculatus TaxID=2770505 RepID=UPI0013DC4B5B|nr:nucleoside triphosphate pyrophosphatase [Candidatus Laterigemmans baculatus]
MSGEGSAFGPLPRAAIPGDRPLILASSSPRRRLLLEAAGYAFTVQAPADSAECGICSRETPPELVARLAMQKAADVAQRVEAGMVLGADTVAECVGQVLGKPENREHAEEMLRRLSGRVHAVYTGVCLWSRPENRWVVDVTRTRLFMEPLSEEQLQGYLDSRRWEGKAGAFGYQDGEDWLRVEEGSESNVVGLPMERLAELLEDFDKRAPRPAT